MSTFAPAMTLRRHPAGVGCVLAERDHRL